jgi:hypothetical protein
MSTLSRLLVGGALLALVGCGADKREKSTKVLQEVGAPRLRREAATFYKQLFVAPTGHYFLPKENVWPKTFRRFEPLQVRAYSDGFSLAMTAKRGIEEGLYVVPAGMDNVPKEGRNAQFEKIEDGIYWYRFNE